MRTYTQSLKLTSVFSVVDLIFLGTWVLVVLVMMMTMMIRMMLSNRRSKRLVRVMRIRWPRDIVRTTTRISNRRGGVSLRLVPWVDHILRVDGTRSSGVECLSGETRFPAEFNSPTWRCDRRHPHS